MRIIIYQFFAAYTLSYVPFLRLLHASGSESSLFAFCVFTIVAVFCIPVFPVHGDETRRRKATLLVDMCVPMRCTERLHNAVAFAWMLGSLIAYHGSWRFTSPIASRAALWAATALFIAFGLVQAVYRFLRRRAHPGHMFCSPLNATTAPKPQMHVQQQQQHERQCVVSPGGGAEGSGQEGYQRLTDVAAAEGGSTCASSPAVSSPPLSTSDSVAPPRSSSRCDYFGVLRVSSLLFEFSFAYALALLPTLALCAP
jgi:hypothetical protein